MNPKYKEEELKPHLSLIDYQLRLTRLQEEWSIGNWKLFNPQLVIPAGTTLPDYSVKIWHLTHNDGDAVGCALVMELLQAMYPHIKVETRYVDNGHIDSEIQDILSNELNKEYNEWIQKILIISDNSCTKEMWDSLTNLSEDSSFFNFVFMFDHHKTNPVNEGLYRNDRMCCIMSHNEFTSAALLMYQWFYPLFDEGLTNHLPSYVSDVFEVRLESEDDDGDTYTKAYDFTGAVVTPKSTAIYVYSIGDDKNDNTYRWSGTQFVEISKSLAIGTTKEKFKVIIEKLNHVIYDISRYDTWAWKKDPRTASKPFIDYFGTLQGEEAKYQENLIASTCTEIGLAETTKLIWDWISDKHIISDIKYELDYYNQLNYIPPALFTAFDIINNKMKKENEKALEMENVAVWIEDFNFNIPDNWGFATACIIGSNERRQVPDLLLTTDKDLDVFLILYPETKTLSFRSVKESVDVSVIAKNYGGGGHKQAAGAKVDTATFISFLSKYYENRNKSKTEK